MKKLIYNTLFCILCISASAQSLSEARTLMTTNRTQGINIIQQLAQDGNPDAMWELGLMYENGNEVINVDTQKAFELYKKSADAGNAIGYYLVAHCYQHGIYVEESHEKSDAFYKKSLEMLTEQAQQGDDIYVLNFIGSAYYWGDGTQPDRVKGAEYYMKAAQLGSPECQYKIGLCYETGEGLEQDAAKSVEWYAKSAAQNFPAAVEKINQIYQGNWLIHAETPMGDMDLPYQIILNEENKLCFQIEGGSTLPLPRLSTDGKLRFDIDMMGMYIDIEMHLTDTEHVSGFAMNQYPFTARKVK